MGDIYHGQVSLVNEATPAGGQTADHRRPFADPAGNGQQNMFAGSTERGYYAPAQAQHASHQPPQPPPSESATYSLPAYTSAAAVAAATVTEPHVDMSDPAIASPHSAAIYIRRGSQSSDPSLYGTGSSRAIPPIPPSSGVPPLRHHEAPADRPVPPLFSLPPLSSINSTADVARNPKSYRREDCRSCETFNVLVSELSDLTKSLISDTGLPIDDSEHASAVPVNADTPLDVQAVFLSFSRSLHILRSVRNDLRSNLLQIPRAAGGVISVLPQTRPPAAGPPAQVDVDHFNDEHRRKRRRHDDGPMGNPNERLNDATKYGERGNHARGYDDTQSHLAPISPKSEMPGRTSQFATPTILPEDAHMGRPFSLSDTQSYAYSPAAIDDSSVPANIHHPPVSVMSHSHSSSSAESVHYANLQRQVTLKSLSLQTLQSEYSSLLQKLHREQLRNQTIERKTTVAETEINTLSNQNEDFIEQIKTLTTQVETYENKMESMRAEFNRDKIQWVSMLSNDNKIVTRLATAQRAWAKEKISLQLRLQDPIRPLSSSDSMDIEASTTGAASQTAMSPVVMERSSSPVTEETAKEELARLRTRIVDLSVTVQRLKQVLHNSHEDRKGFEAQAKALSDAIADSDEKTMRVLAQYG